LTLRARGSGKLHRTAVAPAGPITPENLLAFLALVEAATARAKANLTAMEEATSISDGDGGMKPGLA